MREEYDEFTMGTAPEGCFKVEFYVQENSQLHHDLDAHREPRHQKYGQAALDILVDWSENRHRPQPQWMMGGAIPSSSENDQARREEEERQRQEEQDRQAKAKVKQSTQAMKWN